jgi:hypothetical protein
MSNKLNGLTLTQAYMIRDALEVICPDIQEAIEDRDYLLSQIETIIKNLREVSRD